MTCSVLSCLVALPISAMKIKSVQEEEIAMLYSVILFDLFTNLQLWQVSVFIEVRPRENKVLIEIKFNHCFICASASQSGEFCQKPPETWAEWISKYPRISCFNAKIWSWHFLFMILAKDKQYKIKFDMNWWKNRGSVYRNYEIDKKRCLVS